MNMYTLQPPKFNIGNTITTKIIGCPVIGTIAGIVHGRLYKSFLQNDLIRWTSLYPDWPEKYVYTIIFKDPVRNMTYQEYCDNPNNPFKDKTIQGYYKNVPTTLSVMHPEDDMELFTDE